MGTEDKPPNSYSDGVTWVFDRALAHLSEDLTTDEVGALRKLLEAEQIHDPETVLRALEQVAPRAD